MTAIGVLQTVARRQHASLSAHFGERRPRTTIGVTGSGSHVVVRRLAPASTEPRGVVGFEVVLGALLAAVDGGVFFSIHGVGEQGHGLLG